MEDEFEILASKVLAGEGTEDERSRLRELLAANPGWEKEFAGLAAAWKTLHDAGPVADALDAPPAPIPDARLKELQKVVRATRAAAPSRQEMNVQPPTVAQSVADLFPFRRWLFGRAGLSRLAVSLVLLTMIAIGVRLFLDRPTTSLDPAEAGPVAYCLPGEGGLELRRRGKPVPANFLAVQAGDEIHLPTGSAATLITSNGAVALRGPQHLSGRALAAQGAPNPLATNATGAAIRAALFSPAGQLPAAGLLIAMRDGRSIRLYSPNGSTADLAPLFLWKAEPGKTYDLAITDEFDRATLPWIARGVRPPLDFSHVAGWQGRPLGVNGLYRLRISETGQPLTAGEYTFRTMAAPGEAPARTPAERLLAAFTIMSAAPARVGDALAGLLTLPPELAGSELALRLKLLAFAQLGYAEEFEATAALLARPGQPSR